MSELRVRIVPDQTVVYDADTGEPLTNARLIWYRAAGQAAPTAALEITGVLVGRAADPRRAHTRDPRRAGPL